MNIIAKLKPGDKIAFLAFTVSLFTIVFGMYQFKVQKSDSKISDSLAEKRFDLQFGQIRKTDSLQLLNSNLNLKLAKDNFKKQFDEIHQNDSIQKKLTISNLKNSVRPFIIINTNSTGDSFVGISIKNDGLGPAIFDSVEVKFDGINSHIRNISTFSYRVDLDSFKSNEFDSWDLKKGFALGSGKEQWLFRVRDTDVTDLPNFERLITYHVKVRIKYHSLTGDHFVQVQK